jgi:hypothetical protein
MEMQAGLSHVILIVLLSVTTLVPVQLQLSSQHRGTAVACSWPDREQADVSR